MCGYSASELRSPMKTYAGSGISGGKFPLATGIDLAQLETGA
jgi:hypothetical protein